MKRLIYLIIFAFTFLLSFVSAQCINADDTIMRISASTNAHGEVFNGAGNYGTSICYSTFFNPPINNPSRVCTPTNKIAGLSASTNAHGEIPSASVYTTNVCYGDLVCNSVPGNAACDSGKVEILSLSDSTNAHLGVAGSYNGPSNYKVCCSAPTSGTASVFNAKWKYSNLQDIPDNSLICPIIVFMTGRTNLVGDMTPASFQIYDDDPFPLDDDRIGPTLPGFVVSGTAYSYPLVNLADPTVKSYFESALQETLEGDELEIYFNVSVSGVNGDAVSQIIRFTNDTSMCNYPKPTANIIAPVHKGIYFANTPINFTSACSSFQGITDIEWTVTQGNNRIVNKSSSFIYTFTEGGQVNVKLKCTDLSSKFDIKETQMLVVASPYTFAYINKPEFNGFVYNSPPSSGPYLPQSVRFSASDSFVVNVTSACTIACLGGDCPAFTENSTLACGWLKLPISNAPVPGKANYSNLSFDWRFWDNNWNEPWTSFDGVGVYTGEVPYDDLSNTLNDKSMSVSITHIPTGANANFERSFTLGRCIDNGNTYYDPSTGPISTLNPNGACRGGDAIAGTGDDCCPSGMMCTGNQNPNSHSCAVPSGGNIILKCEDFTTKNACNSNNNTAIPRASYGGNPPACTLLNCFWDNSAGKCGLNVTRYSQTSEGCSLGGGGIIGSCSYTTTSSECINGRRTISYNLVSGDPTTCIKQPTTVPCGSLSFELGFFGFREFILSTILLISIYILMAVYKKRKEN